MDSLDSIHHITIQVADIEQSIHWYTTSFACEVVYKDKTEAILQFANTRLILALPSMQQRHIAFVRKEMWREALLAVWKFTFAEGNRVREMKGVSPSLCPDVISFFVNLLLIFKWDYLEDHSFMF